ncbi:DNA mismatch repair endonuclease MutL [Lichenicola sp.]|uniref:DNA mismatch repair endonuclease MutL n=1 Tax=Lichenicola sp. TaxID=2804529 RepID=UPI003B002070
MPESLISPRIRRLSERVVNRIAAGEVIERPAAAVKELVENAIDAGAGRIAVSLVGGGIDRIEVVDDGIGMSATDLALAVERHCTSKLADESLVSIGTLGFRGEALPSIGAAARLCLTSKQRMPGGGGGEAWRLRVEGGLLHPAEPCAGPIGTQVLVEDLFFATPARRKFLKSVRVEAGHAEIAVRRLAMAAPQIAFRLQIDGRVLLDLPAQSLAARLAVLLADEAGDAGPQGLLTVDGERDGMTLSGFACGPAVHRATVNGQFLVVNGRPVADPVLRTALRVAYRPVMEQGRHAVAALFLQIPAERLDVNVHPAKTELRYADAAGVRSLVIGSLGRALGSGAGHAGLRSGLLTARRPGAGIWYPPERRTDPGPAGFAEAGLAYDAGPSARVLMPRDETRLAVAPAVAPPDDPADAARTLEHPLGAPVAQVLDTYVIAVASDGSLVLVDQHAAHERLTHERLRDQYLQGAISAQRLLLPEVVDLPGRDAERLMAFAGSLAAFGIEIEPFGGRAVLLRSVPALLGNPDPKALLRDLAEELGADELATPQETGTLTGRLDAVIARMACHGSIRAGRRLGVAEMESLLRQMEATPRAATCSHGRPTYLKLSRAEIERMFGRR